MTRPSISWRAALAISLVPARVCAQVRASDTLRAIPNGAVVQGREITLHSFEFVGRTISCYWDSAHGPRQPPRLAERLTRVATVGDTFLMDVRTRVWTRDTVETDSIALDPLTLAPRWSRARFGVHRWTYRINGNHVSWTYTGGGPTNTASADSTFSAAAFLDETEPLLIAAAPALYSSHAVLELPVLTVDRDFLVRYTTNAHVVDSTSLIVPGEGRRPAWVVLVGDDPGRKIDGTKYWIDRETHQVLMWLDQEDSEAEQCPVRYTRTPP